MTPELNKINKKLQCPLTFKHALLALLFTVPQVPIMGTFSDDGKALAQTTGSCPAGTTPQTLEWTGPATLDQFLSQNLNVGGIRTIFDFSDNPLGGVLDRQETLIGPPGGNGGIYGGIPGPNLRWNIGFPGNNPAPPGSSSTFTITFTQPVTLASPLTLLDVDRDGDRDGGRLYQDRVTVTAANGNTPVGVTLRAISPSNVSVTGNVAQGILENALTTENFGNVEVTPSGPVTQIQLVYEPGIVTGAERQDETIGLARINVCVPSGTGTIGDTVFNDANGNNIQDPGEIGIANVPLTLTGAGPDGQLGTPDDTILTTTTNNNGNYSFTNLPPGTYRVTVTNPPAGFSPTLTQPNPVTLATGQNIDTVDFGFRQGVGTIGDTVFNDANGNNIQDPGEIGIANVPLTLTGAGPDGQLGTPDDTTQTTTTNNNGNYSFTNLPPGTYRVAVTNPPAGFSPTLTQPNPVTLAAGQNIDTVDFGFRQGVGAIGDTVFNDANGNNIQDPGEVGISNVTLTLTGAGPDGQFGTPDDTTNTTTTNNNGNYSFTNLPPGTYRVAVTNPPAGFSPTLTQPNPVTLAAGQNLETVDFGFTQQVQGTIGDTVYTDTNGNGVQDPGEPGISARTITLTGAGPDGQFDTPDDINRTTITDSNGRYGITNLPPGNYRVIVTNPPDGSSPTQTPPATIALAANQNLDTVDFGFTQPTQGTIGDTVFLDTNRNQRQDPGERGISGTTVTLTGTGPDGQFDTPDDIRRTTTTDENGRYTFTNLPPGNYRFTVTGLSTNFSPTLTQPGTITLAGGQNIDTVDFGFFGDTVGQGVPDLRIVKRITGVIRNSQRTDFTTFDDGPGSDDNNINQSQPVLGIRDLQTPLQTGDEVEYTIYFLAQNVNNVRFCDLIPESTSYSNGSVSVVGGGTGADQGTFFTPLAPLPSGNTCLSQTNNRGALIVNFGNFDASNGNPAFIRFRVRVD